MFLARGGYVALALALTGWAVRPLGAQVIEGHIYDNQTGAAVVNGNVALRDSLGSVVVRSATDQQGRFMLQVPGPGTYSLLAAGLGYRTTPTAKFEVGADGIEAFDIFLHPKPIELEPLLVTAERIRTELQRQGFYKRMEKGYGHFITPEDISLRPPITEIELMLRAPFIYRDPDAFGSDGRIQMRAMGEVCTPTLFVDGIEVTWWPEREGVIQDWVEATDIVAVEVFRGFGEIPPEWAIIDDSCGLIMVWTVWSEQRSKRRGGGGGGSHPG